MHRSLFISRNIQSLARARAVLAVGFLLAASSGCGLLEKCGCGPAPETYVPISRVDTLWQQEVRFTENTHTGGQVPGVAGRVWLYNEKGKAPVEALGGIEACMDDMTPTASGGQPVQLAYWRFQPSELNQLKHKDMVGTGYSLFLPLETYRPEIKQVRIKLAFVDEKGLRIPAFAEILTLRVDERVIRMYAEQQKILSAAVK